MLQSKFRLPVTATDATFGNTTYIKELDSDIVNRAVLCMSFYLEKVFALKLLLCPTYCRLQMGQEIT